MALRRIKSFSTYFMDNRCNEIETPVFCPMAKEKRNELFSLLNREYKHTNFEWWYIQSNREIKNNDTRSFWWDEGWYIHVLDKDWMLTVHDFKEYPVLIKKYSADDSMIWVSENPKWKKNFWRMNDHWIMLKKWDLKINVDFSKIQIMPWEARINCNSLTEEEISDFMSAKKHEYAKYFYEGDSIYQPRFKVELNSKSQIYISSKIYTSSYQYIIGYAKIDNKWHLRLFYRSHSEWAWRSCPWRRKDYGLSKWWKLPFSCYETTTKVDYHLWDVFDNRITSVFADVDPIMWNSADDLWNEILIDEMKKETKISCLFHPDEIWNIIISNAKNRVWSEKKDKRKQDLKDYINYVEKNYIRDGKWFLTSSLKDICIIKFNWSCYCLNIDEVKDWYKVVPRWLNIDSMKRIANSWYSYDHEYLWKVTCEVCSAILDWEVVLINFSYAEDTPDLVWIDEIGYENASLNSFWIKDRQINASPLTWKPLDYDSQVPWDAWKRFKKYWKYYDVRPLYQENPIIKKYKNLRR